MTTEIKAIVAAVLLALSFGSGWAVNGWRTSSHAAKVVVKQEQHVAAVQTKQAEVSAAVSASAAAVEVQRQIVYRNINHEVIRYVSNPATPVCALGDDWVRLYNAAATGADVSNPASGANGASAPGAANPPAPDGHETGVDYDDRKLRDVPASTGTT